MSRIMPFAPKIRRGHPATADALDEFEFLILRGMRCRAWSLCAAADPLSWLHQASAAVRAPDVAARGC